MSIYRMFSLLINIIYFLCINERTVCDLLDLFINCQGLVILRNLLSHVYLRSGTERKLTNYWRKRQHLLHSTRYLKQIDRFDARNYMSY